MGSNLFVFLIIILDAFALVATLLICIHLLRKPKKQNRQMQQMAKDLNLEIRQKQPGKPLQDMEGSYKGGIVKIFSILDHRLRFTKIRTVVIQFIVKNPLDLNFVITRRTWVKNFSKTIGYKRIHFKNRHFDENFIIHSNQPDLIHHLLNDSIQEKFLEIKKKFDFKGGMELDKNLMIYLEHSPIDTNHKRKRFEAITDLMASIKSQLDNYLNSLQL